MLQRCILVLSAAFLLTAASSRYTPPISSSSFSAASQKIFNVKADYGAAGNGVTDDTTAIQNAINAVGANKGGTVYFPNGIYVVGGALQSTGTANAQIVLPSVQAPQSEQYTVRILGETPVSQIPWFITSPAGNTPSAGVVIKSTLSSGTGSMIGSYGPNGGFLNFTNITFIAENIDFRMVANPTNSALNLYACNSAVLKNVVVDSSNWVGNTVTQPTTATSYGIRLPQNNNGGNTYIDQVQVIGFYTGILDAEHTIGGQVEIFDCNVAIEEAFAYHSSQYSRLLYANCVLGIKWTGVHYLSVSLLDIEHTDQAAWYATTYDIDDGSNNGRGTVRPHIVLAGTGVTQSALINGGANLEISSSNGKLYAKFVDSKGVADGGTFTAGSWVTRTLNTIRENQIGATLTSNQFTLPAGRYRIHAIAPAFSVSAHQCRLYNVTDSAVVENGTSQFSDSAAAIETNSEVWCSVAITAPKAFRLEHQCSATKANSGFGAGNAFTTENVFAIVEVWQQ